MQTTLESTDKHTVKLTVEIPPDDPTGSSGHRFATLVADRPGDGTEVGNAGE